MGSQTGISARQRYEQAERRGLRLAIACRTIIAALVLVYLLSVTAVTDYSLRVWSIGALSIFVLTGVMHLAVIGTRYDRWWMKFAIYGLDACTICALFVIIPVSRHEEVPQIIAFRAYGIYYLFPLVALAALSLSWRLVIWTAAIIVIAWWAAFLWVVSGMERTLSWADIPPEATREDYQSVFLDMDFIGRGNRVEETGFLFLAAVVIALVVYRARAVFFAQIAAEARHREERAARELVTRTLNRFVPAEVADQLIAQDGSLAAKESDGTILILDIAGFSSFAADRPPTDVIKKLDAFLAACTATISSHSGVVVSFTGDGLLASFNTPLSIDNAERAAVEAATELVASTGRLGFSIRVGIATGRIASGSIGSADRRAFTVYGETVNRAARLETLGKTLNRSILIDGATRAALENPQDTEPMGSHVLRGFSGTQEVFAVR